MPKKSAPRGAKSTKKRKTAKKATKKSKTVKKTPGKKPAAKKTSSSKSGAKKASGKKSGAKKGVGIHSQHVDFLTYKIEQVRKFYEDLLELRAQQRDADGLNYLVVRTSSSSSIGFMPPHPDMAGEQPLPRESTLYFMVTNLDAVYAHLVAKGVAFMGPPEEMPWGHRVITTTDPEGRTVMLASSLGKKK